jgi:hypothetical protein
LSLSLVMRKFQHSHSQSGRTLSPSGLQVLGT